MYSISTVVCCSNPGRRSIGCQCCQKGRSELSYVTFSLLPTSRSAMSSFSPRHQPLGLADSPMSPLSSPSSPSFTDAFPSVDRSKTVYDILLSPDNPPDFYHNDQQGLVATAGCAHLAKYKRQRRRQLDEDDFLLDDDLFASYRSLVRYSLQWQKSRKELQESPTKKRKQVE